MKPRCLFLASCTLFICLTNLPAQVGAKQSIFDELQNIRPGKGRVVIDQPAGIQNKVGYRINGEIETSNDGKSYIRHQGFRIQVFSGNDHRTSKEEAFKREKEINEAIPELMTYVNFDAPFWRLRVGDFNAREEAYDTQHQLMQLFPNYRKEMYIVREEIKIPVHESY
jgi:hypothetical protein